MLFDTILFYINLCVTRDSRCSI